MYRKAKIICIPVRQDVLCINALIVASGWMLPREVEMVLIEQVCQGSKM